MGKYLNYSEIMVQASIITLSLIIISLLGYLKEVYLGELCWALLCSYLVLYYYAVDLFSMEIGHQWRGVLLERLNHQNTYSRQHTFSAYNMNTDVHSVDATFVWVSEVCILYMVGVIFQY